MNTRVSLYLDLLRFSAAMMVMFYHVALSRISGGVWQWYRDSHIGSDVVILFFILSGYVIAYVVDAKKENKTDYMVNRLSRLYSVIVPALLLTMVVDTIGIYLSPDFYIPWINSYAIYDNVTSFFANLFFVNQIWTFHIRPSTNGPFWSLSYEFWYYMLFFAVCYFTGKKRVLLALLILLIMGPKLWVLAPTWWLGVWTYRKSQTINHSQVIGWLLFLSPIAIYTAIKYFGIDADLLIWTKEVLGKETVSTWLRYSDEFIISFVYAVLVSMHFLGLVTVAKKHLFWLERFKKPIRFWAGLTFSLYLFHSPLMNFFASVLPGDITSVWRHLAIVVCIMLVTVALGSLTEKHKYKVRNLFRWIWQQLSTRKTQVQTT